MVLSRHIIELVYVNNVYYMRGRRDQGRTSDAGSQSEWEEKNKVFKPRDIQYLRNIFLKGLKRAEKMNILANLPSHTS